jgi:hypothetical protein
MKHGSDIDCIIFGDWECSHETGVGQRIWVVGKKGEDGVEEGEGEGEGEGVAAQINPF